MPRATHQTKRTATTKRRPKKAPGGGPRGPGDGGAWKKSHGK